VLLMAILGRIPALLQGGLGNLAAYLAAHVLLCLLPAFFIAGGLSALVPQEAITRYLGPKAPKVVSYPAAALGGLVLAVCSCTIMPLFAGIHRKGAGLGPAITFLFVGPAINILAFTYTGVAIGMDIAVARLVLAVVFGVGIGLIMALTFRQRSDDAPVTATAFGGHASVEGRVWVFMLLLLAVLIAGTLQVAPLTNSHATLTLPVRGLDELEAALARLVPADADAGIEGVSAQGAMLIVMLGLLALTAWRGLGRVDEGYNGWTWATLVLIVLTLLLAGAHITPAGGAVQVGITGKMIAVALGATGLVLVGWGWFESYELQQWLWETWRFVRQIFPLLIIGVFSVGVIRGLIRPEWIQALAGRNSLAANLVGVLFGVFMYFPTLVEVPIARMFLSLGMHRGPLLAYLMADPELSLQSILITSSVIGKAKAWVYVGWVTLFSTLAGLVFGAWTDGAPLWALALYVSGGLLVLAAMLWRASRRQAARGPLATIE